MRPAKKKFTKDEAQTILELWEEGHSASEISKVVDRTEGFIGFFLYNERKTGFYSKRFHIKIGESAKTDKAAPKQAALITVKANSALDPKTGRAIGISKVAHPAPAPTGSTAASGVNVYAQAPAKTLKDFSPRDMIKHLYDLGYRIENNRLVCIQKAYVKLEDIING